MEAEEARRWSGLLRCQSWEAYCGTTEDAAYLDVGDVFYLRCRRDRALPFEEQGRLVEGIEKAGGKVSLGCVGVSGLNVS